ncbi:uncharacterized protein LOC143039372 [Oratosquilla oratoria]|uniref:uncharacterized protein LOC143039372 n=1 Tax=Oratosquilla oratoria TaxID=337810 RepID=UPI003F767C13
MTAEDSKDAKSEKTETNLDKKAAFTKKIIRIITVMAYVSGVSGAGVLLSLYYIIFWDPQIKGTRPRGYLRADPYTADAPVSETVYEHDPLQPMALTAAAAHVPVVDPRGDQMPSDDHYPLDYQNNHSADNGMALEAPNVLPLNEAKEESVSSYHLLTSSQFASLPPENYGKKMAQNKVQDRFEGDKMRDNGLDGQVYKEAVKPQQKESMRSFHSVEYAPPPAV